MHQDKSQFYFGIAVGIAVISTVGFFTVLIGGSGIKLDWKGAEKEGTAATTGTTVTSQTGKAPKFEACVADPATAAKVDAEFNEGASIGVRGTPATFINGYLISGAYPYEQVKAVIDDLLAGKTPTEDYLKGDDGKITKATVPGLRDGEPYHGSQNGKLFIAEYSDYECPYCLRFEPTIERIIQEYGDKITFVYRNFPLSFHPQAKPAAFAAECAKDQGKFWEMHDQLFQLNSANNMNPDAYIKAAVDLGLK